MGNTQVSTSELYGMERSVHSIIRSVNKINGGGNRLNNTRIEKKMKRNRTKWSTIRGRINQKITARSGR